MKGIYNEVINSESTIKILQTRIIQWIKIKDKSEQVLWLWIEFGHLLFSRWIYEDLQKDNPEKDDATYWRLIC